MYNNKEFSQETVCIYDDVFMHKHKVMEQLPLPPHHQRLHIFGMFIRTASFESFLTTKTRQHLHPTSLSSTHDICCISLHSYLQSSHVTRCSLGMISIMNDHYCHFDMKWTPSHFLLALVPIVRPWPAAVHASERQRVSASFPRKRQRCLDQGLLQHRRL